MSAPAESFSDWIGRVPAWRGWLQLSPERSYAHTEEDYNSQYGVTPADPAEGGGLCALLQTHAVDTAGPALEIGCGTGYLTFGVGQHYPGPDFLITDPSPAFLRLTQNQFEGKPAATARRHYAVFNADDLHLLPRDMFSVIALRSTLHHILKWEEFVAGCARALRPDGALIMGAEPVESGYLLMAAVARSIPTAFKAAGIALRPEWRRQLDDFTDTVKFGCIRDIDKAAAEDKHLFQPQELAELGTRHGLTLTFLPCATFRDYAPPYARSFKGFADFFLLYLQYSMKFDAEFLGHIRAQLQDQLGFLDDCYRSHPGPAMTGVFILKKNAGRPVA